MVSVGEMRSWGIFLLHVFPPNRLLVCFLDVEEAYAYLEASRNDTWFFFPLYYLVNHKYEDRIWSKNTQQAQR